MNHIVVCVVNRVDSGVMFKCCYICESFMNNTFVCMMINVFAVYSPNVRVSIYFIEFTVDVIFVLL